MEIKRIFPWIFLVTAINSFLWMDSLDQYVSSRFHISLAEYLPEEIFAPSSQLKAWLNHEQKVVEVGQSNTTTMESSSNSSLKESEKENAHENTPTHSHEESASNDKTDDLTLSTKNAESVEEIVDPNQNKGSLQTVVGNSRDQSEIFLVKNQEKEAPMPSTYASLNLKSESIKVMFAGDSMMQGVAPIAVGSLKKIYPKGVYVDLSKQSTGLTVKRYFDWPSKIKDGITKENFKIIIIFLGPNDPWDIYENHKVYKFPSKDWADLYQSRVDSVLEVAKQNDAKVIWVGLPNMAEDRVKKGAVIQNEIFRNETKKYQYQYISTEDFIGRLDQPFKSVIHDPVKGDILIRASDGIHFAPAGLRMISNEVVEAFKRLDKE